MPREELNQIYIAVVGEWLELVFVLWFSDTVRLIERKSKTPAARFLVFSF